MEQDNLKREMISELQKKILLMQGFKPVPVGARSLHLGPIEAAFPNSVFPTGAIHEFLGEASEHAAACTGFISGILSALMQNGGACLWISKTRKLFPAALKLFGVEPCQIIFIDLQSEKDVLWVMEEALKCKGLAAVVAEVREISFAQSQRLQLALEKTKVTGFVLRTDANKINTTACVARWRIIPLASKLEEGMPGIGFPRWRVDLLRVRNGNPGSWNIEWSGDGFITIAESHTEQVLSAKWRKIG